MKHGNIRDQGKIYMGNSIARSISQNNTWSDGGIQTLNKKTMDSTETNSRSTEIDSPLMDGRDRDLKAETRFSMMGEAI